MDLQSYLEFGKRRNAVAPQLQPTSPQSVENEAAASAGVIVPTIAPNAERRAALPNIIAPEQVQQPVAQGGIVPQIASRPAPDSFSQTPQQLAAVAPQAAQTPIADTTSTVSETPTSSGIVPQLPKSERLLAQAQEIENRRYGNQKNPDGSLKRDASGKVLKEKNSADKWTTGTKIKNILIGALKGYAQGGLGGAIAGSIIEGTDRNATAKRQDEQMLRKLYPQIAQARESEKIAQERDYRETQKNEILRRPTKEAEAFRQKVELEGIKNANRAQAIFAKDERKNKEYKIETAKDGSGRIIKKYPDREEPYLDPDTGEQLYNPFEKGYETTTETGQKVTVKGSQILSSENAKAFRDAMIAGQETKYNADVADDNSQDVVDYNNKKTAIQSKLVESNTAIQQAESQMQTIDAQISQAENSGEGDADVSKTLPALRAQKAQLQNTIAKARADYDGNKLEFDKLQKNPPRKPISLPRVGEVKFAESEIRSRMKGKYTEEQIQAKIKEAKDKGLLK